jgi:hypothetical protein
MDVMLSGICVLTMNNIIAMDHLILKLDMQKSVTFILFNSGPEGIKYEFGC